MNYTDYKQQVLEYSQEMTRKGYLFGTGGNVSARIKGEEALAITPSGRDYMTMTLDDICVCGFDGRSLEGDRRPSIEMGMHTAVYQNRPDINAVIHTHQPYASIFAITKQPIPALFDEQVIELGDEVVVAPYGMSGTQALADNLASVLGNRCNAYILQNHGVVCTGITMAKAAVNVQVLEKTARVYHYALSGKQEIAVLSNESVNYFFNMLKTAQQKEIIRKL